MVHLIRHGMVVQPEGVFQADVLVAGDTIREIAPEIKREELPFNSSIIDAGGCYVLPGIIDAHTHFRLASRSAVTADGFAEGSRAAAFGGVTTVIDFADDLEEKTLAESSRERMLQMSAGMAVDFSLHQGVYRMRSTLEEELLELKKSGVRALKIFTTYKQAGYLLSEQHLKRLFSACRDHGLLVTVHAEDDSLIEEITSFYQHQHCPPSMHPVLRPAEAEYRAITHIAGLAEETGASVYIVHLSSSLGLQAVREARKRGVQITAETAPHYLQLDEGYLRLKDSSLYIMTPPLRSIEDTQELWNAVVSGEISVIATDHCAFTPDQKLSFDDCRHILPGIPGTEELLPLIYTHGVKERGISMPRLADLLSREPARQFGLYPKKGVLAAGSHADLVVYDPSVQWTINNDTQHTAAGYTPYAGSDVSGKVKLTMRRGEILIEGDQYYGLPGTGQFQFSEAEEEVPG